MKILIMKLNAYCFVMLYVIFYMGYMKKMKNLNIYFSDECNFKCTYCCMQHEGQNNKHIQECFKNGSFIQTILNTITSETTSIGLWGLEPSVNGYYFSPMIRAILNANPQIKKIMFSTHGSLTLYNFFVAPLLNKDINLYIQFSVDGPAEINDINRQKGAYNHIINSIKNLIRTCPKTV